VHSTSLNVRTTTQLALCETIRQRFARPRQNWPPHRGGLPTIDELKIATQRYSTARHFARLTRYVKQQFIENQKCEKNVLHYLWGIVPREL
jgi:hypothetical protein